jgi:hypothetical protein
MNLEYNVKEIIIIFGRGGEKVIGNCTLAITRIGG